MELSVPIAEESLEFQIWNGKGTDSEVVKQ